MRRDLRNSHHLATISFDGRFWDVYLELEDAQSPGDSARGRIAFSAADEGQATPVRTATIFMEDSAQAVVNRARDFKTHQLVALLRSALPDPTDSSPEQG
jgi:hypothetical protein